jgi:hypothetical protein
MKNLVVKAAVAAIVGSFAAGGYAQNREAPFTVRAGLFYPSAQAARATGNQWFTVGADYRLPTRRVDSPDPRQQAFLSVSLDYYGEGNFRNIPILLNYTGQTERLFWTGGVGIAMTREPRLGGGASNNTRLGYALGVGYNVAEGATPVYVQARWMGAMESNLNGFSVTIGVRL